ncbi:MAG TPA: hypothetical protein VGC10_07705, partial [Sphingomonas sp.]
MSAELVFDTNPMSRGRVVRWMLEETGAMKTPAYPTDAIPEAKLAPPPRDRDRRRDARARLTRKSPVDHSAGLSGLARRPVSVPRIT